jgi:hypothetical protein
MHAAVSVQSAARHVVEAAAADQLNAVVEAALRIEDRGAALRERRFTIGPPDGRSGRTGSCARARTT